MAIESSRGWRLGKAKASDRVDPIIALAMAAVAAVEQRGLYGPLRAYSFPGFEELPAQYQPWSPAAPDGLPIGDIGFCG